MSIKASVSLEDVRRNPKLLEKFIKQHKFKGDKERFEKLLRKISAEDQIEDERHS